MAADSSAASVRAATQTDIPAIADTLREAFTPFERLYTPAAFAATVVSVDDLRNRWAHGPTWVAELNGEVVGTVGAIPRLEEFYVRSMAVRPTAQGHGVGQQMLQIAEDAAVLRGYRHVQLSTTPFLRAAIRLYERNGYQRSGVADLFGTPLIVMTKTCDFSG